VIEAEVHVIRAQLRRNNVDLVCGSASFVDSTTLAVREHEGVERRLSARRIVIAVGTRPTHPTDVDFDGRTILDSDGILQLEHIPRSVLVVGAGVIGIEYASMFAALGTKVTVVEKRQRLLEFCDAEIVEALQYHLRELGFSFVSASRSPPSRRTRALPRPQPSKDASRAATPSTTRRTR
jgi:NAD(P) transhydrogenase